MQNQDLIQVVVNQTLVNRSIPVTNVFNFIVSGFSGNILLSDFVPDVFGPYWGANIVEVIASVQSTQLRYDNMVVNNLSDYIDDFGTYTFDQPFSGIVTDQYTSAQDAWSFILYRTNRSTRHGHKRIAGIPESFTTDGVATSTAITALENVADVLGSPFTVETVIGGGGPLFTPVIIKAPLIPPTAPIGFNPVTGAAYRGVGTQNSRKRLL